ncbi:fructose-bisphosphate aldolase 3, chloroplastic-like [Chenopodium quinoa]|uniref:fructose-bisphosphate aldolase 3, chloroplastic-like n=1 Tax=Chenopodium quinoa TaxID=63459 RepID=UPI000B78DD35|nr:fructose-bisphosphate aldolase 3, chloroplastic-like [Chenopodium quinoa]
MVDVTEYRKFGPENWIHLMKAFDHIKSIASPARGILAIDESNATCGKRLASIGLDNTENNRQMYRQLLLTTPGLGEHISSVILFEETLYQSTTDGKKLSTAYLMRMSCLSSRSTRYDSLNVFHIRLLLMLVPLPGSNNESWCQGLDGLASRSAEYYNQGARFAKWRIPCEPFALAVKEAAWGIARYDAISQVHTKLSLLYVPFSMLQFEVEVVAWLPLCSLNSA